MTSLPTPPSILPKVFHNQVTVNNIKTSNFEQKRDSISQITNILTTVTSTYSSGVISTQSAAIGTQSSVVFDVVAPCTSTDTVVVSLNSYAGAGLPLVSVSDVTDGQFSIRIFNAHILDATNSSLSIAFSIL